MVAASNEYKCSSVCVQIFYRLLVISRLMFVHYLVTWFTDMSNIIALIVSVGHDHNLMFNILSLHFGPHFSLCVSEPHRRIEINIITFFKVTTDFKSRKMIIWLSWSINSGLFSFSKANKLNFTTRRRRERGYRVRSWSWDPLQRLAVKHVGENTQHTNLH